MYIMYAPLCRLFIYYVYINVAGNENPMPIYDDDVESRIPGIQILKTDFNISPLRVHNSLQKFEHWGVSRPPNCREEKIPRIPSSLCLRSETWWGRGIFRSAFILSIFKNSRCYVLLFFEISCF